MVAIGSTSETMMISVVAMVFRSFVRTVPPTMVFAPMLVSAKVSVVIPIVGTVTRVVMRIVVVVGERNRCAQCVDPVIVIVIGVRHKGRNESSNQNAGTNNFCAAMFHLCLQFIVGMHTVTVGQ